MAIKLKSGGSKLGGKGGADKPANVRSFDQFDDDEKHRVVYQSHADEMDRQLGGGDEALAANKKKLRESDANFARLMEDETSGEFYLCLVFPNQAGRDALIAYCRKAGIRVEENSFVDGHAINAALSGDKTPAPDINRRYVKRPILASMARKPTPGTGGGKE